MSEPPSPTRPAGSSVEVVVTDDQTDHQIDSAKWARLAEHTCSALDHHHGELSLTFVDEATIAELNAEHMGGDGPTDVLAFPLDADDGDLSGTTASSQSGEAMPVLLGDVIICPAVAAANAADHVTSPHPGHPTHDGSLDDELALLVVHGVLHVLGMDHAETDETETMQATERSILATFADLEQTTT